MSKMQESAAVERQRTSDTSSQGPGEVAPEVPKKTFGAKLLASLLQPGSALQIIIAAVLAIVIGVILGILVLLLVIFLFINRNKEGERNLPIILLEDC